MTKRLVGGYTYQQEVMAGLGACRKVRELLERLLTERPGATQVAWYVAQMATAMLRIQEAFEALNAITREARDLPGGQEAL